MIVSDRALRADRASQVFIFLLALQCFVRTTMDPGYLIGTLAFFTIGAVLLLSIAHFRQLLANPRDRVHIDNILRDGKGATTVAAEAMPAGQAVPLKTRLDSSIASQHPADPEASIDKADRVAAFDSAKVS